MPYNTYTVRIPGQTNPVNPTIKNFFAINNNAGSGQSQVIRIHRIWKVMLSTTTAAASTSYIGMYDIEKCVGATLAIGGGARVPLIPHDSKSPKIPTTVTNIVTGTTWVSNMFTFVTTLSPAAASLASGTTWTGTICTLICSGAHGLVAGQNITVSGATPSAYNGTFMVVNVPGTTSLNVINTGTAAAWTSGGTVSGGHSYQVGQNVVISGVTPTGYNGVWQITSIPNSTSFMCPATISSPTNWTSGGTVDSAIQIFANATYGTIIPQSIGIYRQIARSTASNIISSTYIRPDHLQTNFATGALVSDIGYQDANVENITLRAGETLRMYNLVAHGPPGWPTTAATFDVFIELSVDNS